MDKQLQDEQVWFTLSEAAKRLNVHPTTLRRWANNGDIPVMVTPGGHRRFAANDIASLSQSSIAPSSGGIAGLYTAQAMAHARQDIAVRRGDETWLTEFDADARSRNRLLGQQLMALTMRYLSNEGDDEMILGEARQVGREYARIAIAEDIPLKATLEASMFFRDSLVETAMQLPETTTIRPGANVRLLKRVHTLMNAVHLSVAEEYESRR